MELKQLRYFAVVAEEENFSRAADKLHVAQSAISRHVRKLEEELGVELFKRLPDRRVRLSPAGQVFMEDTVEILRSVSAAQERAVLTMQGMLGTLQVSFNDMATRSNFFRSCVMKFRDAVPQARIKLNYVPSYKQVDEIKAGGIDAGFLAFRESGREAGDEFKHFRVHSEEILLAIPTNHALASRKRIVLRALAEYAFVSYPRAFNPIIYDEMITACHAGGLTPKIAQEIGREDNVLGFVSMGMGLGFATASAQTTRPPGIIFRRVADLNWSMHLAVVWLARNEKPLLKRFLAIVEQFVSEGLKRSQENTMAVKR